MAQIPLGRFGAASAVPVVEPGRVVIPDPSTLTRGDQMLAGSVEQIATNYQQQKNREDQALAKVKASNALIDREAQIKTIAADLNEKMRTGALDYTKADETYNASVAKLDPLNVPGLDEVSMAEVGNSAKRLQLGGLDGVRRGAAEARIGSAQADIASRMDMLGKDAGMPGADPAAINRRMDAEDIDVVGRFAFGLEWESKKQSFKDSVYETNATQRINSGSGDIAETMLVGEDILNKSKAAKAGDGKASRGWGF